MNSGRVGEKPFPNPGTIGHNKGREVFDSDVVPELTTDGDPHDSGKVDHIDLVLGSERPDSAASGVSGVRTPCISGSARDGRPACSVRGLGGSVGSAVRFGRDLDFSKDSYFSVKGQRIPGQCCDTCDFLFLDAKQHTKTDLPLLKGW